MQYSKLLEKTADNALKGKAAAFFLAALHPDSLQRVTAAQALRSPRFCSLAGSADWVSDAWLHLSQ